MPFYLVRNDITKMEVDVIVNTANPKPIIGSGVDSGIHKKAGPQLLEARKRIGDIAVGDAAVTDGFGLPAKFVIHTSGPVWQGGDKGETETLSCCYSKSLHLALEHQCGSVAFPLISSGNYGFPKGVALQTAVNAISGFMMEHEMDVYLVVFDKEAYSLSEKLLSDVKSYIDEHYVEEIHEREHEAYDYRRSRFGRGRCEAACASFYLLEEECMAVETPMASIAPMAPAAGQIGNRSLEDLLKEVDDSFATHLFRLIDQRGLTDPQVYKRANLDRKLFSKIRNNEAYKPSKKTALSLAVALELSLDETVDLLARAGYALSKSNRFDLIVQYYIENKNYNIFHINSMLYEIVEDTLST